ncbi:MAG: glycosyltransferase, partial [Bacteroidales bacterium]|nr:glycosyltransferase [Bacteroidales bacterium]
LEEKKEIKNIFKNNTIWEAVNITDSPINSIKEKKEDKTFSFLFASRISPIKNIDFLVNIFLRRVFSKDITIDLYGPIEDKEYWNKCMILIKQLPDNITCNYHGAIDYYSLNNIYSTYDFFILPTHGENFGHAIYSALANGLPAIISNKTPWQDLEIHNAGFVLDLNIDIFASTIEKCLNLNIEEREQMKKNALKYAKDFYNKSTAIKDTKNMFIGKIKQK